MFTDISSVNPNYWWYIFTLGIPNSGPRVVACEKIPASASSGIFLVVILSTKYQEDHFLGLPKPLEFVWKNSVSKILLYDIFAIFPRSMGLLQLTDDRHIFFWLPGLEQAAVIDGA